MVNLVSAKCPSCGASLKIDRSLKFTKCEYCNTEIIVQEAIENLLKVELKDSPTLDNYLKLGNRYYENREYEEAYQIYSKAEEIDPDNPIIVLRKGLAKSLICDYNHLEINSALNGLKESLNLMKKMSFSKKEINQSIDECGEVLYISRNYLLDVYKNNKLTKAQTTGYIERLESCLNGFIYLDSIVSNNKELEKKIVFTIIETIDIILGNQNNTKYNLSTSYINELKETKKKYELRFRTPEINNKNNSIKKEKVVEVENKTSKFKDILCYLMIALLSIMLMGAIFSKESFLVILLWIITIISFIPKIKKVFVQKYGFNVGKIIVGLRVILIIAALIILGSSPIEFENTFKGENDVKITLKSGKFTMVTSDGTINGEYHWDTNNNDYYIHVRGNNNQNYEYRYRKTTDGGNLCLLENNQCKDIYLPIN